MSYFAIHDDPPQSSADAEGKQRRRVDIVFELTQRGVHPRFPIEAKRLNNTKGVGEYLGADGLGCFLSSSYAPDATDAGMLAYVQDGAVEDWAKKVADHLDRNRTTHGLASGARHWTAETFVEQPVVSYRTHHTRSRRALAVYHTFMPCQRAASRSGSGQRQPGTRKSRGR